ncbi:hypothetical protein SPSYN_02265 [Sporotomaculum syntrophicum]|uniref:Uncharacterized protein n=1 Tax=Sporotomaculum syntrophicum TaxID=182264 RepID=A0A9D2WQ02_9FIRM|nr:hypothetical protein SPSYN_02265 [Sporotomaculum syntrophicum]
MLPAFPVVLPGLRRPLEIIAKPHRKLVQVVTDLQEMNFGYCEGLTAEEIIQKKQ